MKWHTQFFGFLLLLFIAPVLNAQLKIAEQAWVQRYNNPTTNGYDVLYDMTIDASGNVYVTGYSSDLTTSSDIVTIKYDASGNVVWLSRYNNANENKTDEGRAIAVDNSGNVYVTGISYNPFTDFVTLKYDANGILQWVSFYDGPGSYGDIAHDIAVDNSGNVFVIGEGSGVNDLWDYTTIKYNPAGAVIWISTYNGPDNDVDNPSTLVLDASGNAYVTGGSWNTGTEESDYITIKYNSTTGAAEWVSRYDPANNDDYASDIAVDGSGYVYVTGSSIGTSEDFATIKYNAATGGEVWVSRYNGGSSDEANEVAVDDSGNVIVIGQSRTTTVTDYATVKYNSAGAQQWVRLYNGKGYQDTPLALFVDVSRNIYVTGFSYGSTGFFDTDIATVKYTSFGEEEWSVRYNGTANGADDGRAIVVDGSGNVYVAGSSQGTGTQFDYVTIKYEQVLLPLDDAIQELSNDVQNLPLSAGNKNALNSKLQNAIAKYNSGDLIAARNLLYAFINQLNQFVASGSLTATQAQRLIDYAMEIIAEINFLLAKTADSSTQVPEEFALFQNHPNPFNPATVINWQLPVNSHVTLKIYDILGKEVVTLVDEIKEAGSYSVRFNASNLPSGRYLYKLEAGSFVESKKMLLIK